MGIGILDENVKRELSLGGNVLSAGGNHSQQMVDILETPAILPFTFTEKRLGYYTALCTGKTFSRAMFLYTLLREYIEVSSLEKDEKQIYMLLLTNEVLNDAIPKTPKEQMVLKDLDISMTEDNFSEGNSQKLEFQVNEIIKILNERYHLPRQKRKR